MYNCFRFKFIKLLLSSFLLVFFLPAYAKENSWQNLLIKQGYIAIPLNLAATQKTLLINVYYNHKSLPFIFDTGSSRISIDKRLLPELNSLPTGKIITAGGGDAKRRQAQEVLIPKLQLANFVSNNNIANALDYSFIKIDKQSVGGMIGFDFLTKHHAIVDIANNYLYLIASDQGIHNKILANALIKAGYRAIDLVPTPTHHRTLRVSINNNLPQIFLLDSGLAQTLIAQNYAEKLNLKVGKTFILEVGNGGGQAQIFPVPINKLSVGPIDWQPGEIGMMNFAPVKVGVPLAGALGLDWMIAKKAIIDAANNKIYIKN